MENLMAILGGCDAGLRPEAAESISAVIRWGFRSAGGPARCRMGQKNREG